MRYHLLEFPTELLELFIDEIDSRVDLLSLSLTCSHMKQIIIPGHLPYRSITISVTNVQFLDRIKQQPELAARVRDLTVVHIPVSVPTRLRYGDTVHATDYNRLQNLPKEMFENLLSILSGLPRLRNLSLQGSHDSSYRLTIAAVEELLGVHIHQLRRLALDITPFAPIPYFCAWDMSNMHSLELMVSGIRLDRWNILCEVISRSPKLQVLSMPSIKETMYPSPAYLTPLPRLAALKQFSSPLDICHDTIVHHIISFLAATPSITDLRWMSLDVPSPQDMPELPKLKRILPGKGSAEFAHNYLETKSVGTARFEAFECYRLNLHPLDLMRRLNPYSLRALHIHDIDNEGLAGVLALSRIFLSLEELVLPWHRSLRMARLAGMLGGGGDVREYPSIHDIMPLFLNLRDVYFVDTGESLLLTSMWWRQDRTLQVGPDKFCLISNAIQNLHKRYPRLKCVNGWRVDDQCTQRVELTKHVVERLFLSMSPSREKFVLTKDGYSMGYAGAMANLLTES